MKVRAILSPPHCPATGRCANSCNQGDAEQLAAYLIDEIQEVYRLKRVSIND
jgi:hypothetical protein